MSENKQKIEFFNRYTQEIEEEKVLGEQWLRRIYSNPLGSLALHALIKRKIFSQIIGASKNCPSSKKDIAPFIKEYKIDMKESQLQADEFPHFNAFFYRKLTPEARPLCQPNQAAFPADGRHMGWKNASEIDQVFIKGQRFDIQALLDCPELAKRFENGSVILSRLCPVDYHRFHFPVSGIPGMARPIAGPLASVSPICLRRKLSWLWTNKREITLIESPQFGLVAMLEVGATCVGSIHQTYDPCKPVEMGDEKGYFSFGGSTVMTFFEPKRIRLAKDLLEQTAAGRELFARQGDAMSQ